MEEIQTSFDNVSLISTLTMEVLFLPRTPFPLSKMLKISICSQIITKCMKVEKNTDIMTYSTSCGVIMHDDVSIASTRTTIIPCIRNRTLEVKLNLKILKLVSYKTYKWKGKKNKDENVIEANPWCHKELN